jgi:hypothetical protein
MRSEILRREGLDINNSLNGSLLSDQRMNIVIEKSALSSFLHELIPHIVVRHMKAIIISSFE